MAGERILIVEAEPAVARGLAYGLASEGFDDLVEGARRVLDQAERVQYTSKRTASPVCQHG